TQSLQVKGNALLAIAQGNALCIGGLLVSLRPERAIATRYWLTPFQGYGWSWTFLHRALPCASAHKAFSLILMSLGRISDIHNISLFLLSLQSHSR
ncbi:MAG: hypothetical protein LBN93_00650, partial [Candidatus Symbiothrix sp.]|nr:hypothetical protein [Candidatus Symbiothrix sp.]